MTRQLAVNERTATKAAIKRASRAAQARLRNFDAATQAQVVGLYESALAAIKADIASAADPNGTLRLQVLQSLQRQLESRLSALATDRDELLSLSLKGAADIGASPFAGQIARALPAISDDAVRLAVNFVAADGLQLSDRLWRLDQNAREAVARAVQGAIVRGQSASAAVNQFLAAGQGVPADLAGKAQESLAPAVQAAVGRELMTGKMSARAQALRVFRTEINRAHGLAFQTAAFETDGVVGTRFLLSPRHPEIDICDMHAKVNRYGLGPGVYPKGKSPWPAHPNTLSFEEVVFDDEITDEDKAGAEDRITWIKAQPPGIQVGVLGSVRKAQALRADLLSEGQIATPWEKLKPRIESKLKIDPDNDAALRAALAREQAKRQQALGDALTSEVAEAQAAAAKAEAAAALAERVAKAQQLAATLKLEKITPGQGWPGKALEKLQGQGTLAGLSPVEQLAKVETLADELQAAKALQSAKAKAKKAMIEGKPVPPAGQAWLDQAAPDELAELQQLVDAAKAEAAADKALAAITPGEGYAGKALAKLAAGPKFDALPATQKLAQVEALADELQQLKALQSAKAKAKKALIEGKPVPPAGQAWLDQADADELAELKADVEAAKTAAAAKAAQANPGGPLQFTDFEKIGGQGGSNPGGLYQHRGTGERWYIKTPASAELARNEVLAGELYRAAGVEMPELRLIDVNGQQGVASRIIDGLEADKAALTRGRLPGAQEHLAVDAWLANWDVVGLGFDNLLVKAGRAFRIDTGGALRFRAQGGTKGAAWGPQVTELESLRDAGMNAQAASVFKHASRADIEAGVARILAIKRETIEDLVERFGPLDLSERQRLVQTLLARQADLGDKYPHLRKQPSVGESASGAGRLSEAELADIAAARVNGKQVTIDGGDIEDHAVVFSRLTGADGRPVLRAWLKVRPDAGAKVAQTIIERSDAGLSYGSLDQNLVTAIKGLAHRSGQDLRDVDLKRITEALDEYQRLQQRLAELIEKQALPRSALADFRRHYQPWAESLEAVARRRVGEAFEFKPSGLFSGIAAPDLKPSGPAAWTQIDGPLEFNVARLERSHAKIEQSTSLVPGTARWYRMKTDQVDAFYVPHNAGNNFSAEGYLKIDIHGDGPEASAAAFRVLEDLGLDNSRTTPAQRRELFLDKSAYILTIRRESDWQAYRKLDAIDDADERARQKLAFVNQRAGRDITASPEWERAEGRHQAFGHGRMLQYRADLDPQEFNRFARTYGLYHNPTGLGIGSGAFWDRLKTVIDGGGVFSSQADRVRRGVSLTGSSVSADFRTGGANYFYTRIVSKSSQARTPGVWFKPEALKRMDAISYNGDKFGQSDEAFQRRERLTQPGEWRDAARSSANETIFRDGFSVFDDVDKIILTGRAEYTRALAELRAMGYTEWPDGRALEDVFDYPR